MEAGCSKISWKSCCARASARRCAALRCCTGCWCTAWLFAHVLVQDGWNIVWCCCSGFRVYGFGIRIVLASNEAGLAEAGIDGGGLFKDLMEEPTGI